ncbi:MAG: DUF167 domain-containing protein [Elusimicrobia bacterium]|nr:DUF167 domain-containing protein [Elusimicrobiota bacterium]
MTFIKLKVHLDSKRSSIAKKADDAYEVWVRAPAERGLANQEAIESLARALSQPAKRLRIVKGSQSPNKIVRIF